MNAAPNRNVARRGMLWFCTVAMLLFIGVMALAINQDGWHTPQVALMGICAAVTLGLILTLVNASRFWWAMRVVTFIIFSLSFSYVIYEGFFIVMRLVSLMQARRHYSMLCAHFLSLGCRACFTHCGGAHGGRRAPLIARILRGQTC